MRKKERKKKSKKENKKRKERRKMIDEKMFLKQEKSHKGN